MSKVLGPFLSFHATGNIGKSLTAKQWKGIKQVIRYSKPSGPPSAAQTAQRLRVHNAMLSWRKFLHPTDAGTAWNLLAKSIRPHIWGYNHALKSLIPQLAADADASYAISIEEKGTGKVYVEMQNMDDGSAGDEIGLFDVWSGSDPRALYKIGSNSIFTGNVATPSLGSSGDTVYFRLIKSYWRSGIYKITLLYPEIVLDLMEYASDALAQAAYVSSDAGYDAWVEVAGRAGGTETYIYSLAVYNDKLYGGTAQNGRLYEWNGSDAWVEVAGKLGTEIRIYSLAVYNDKLYGGTLPNGRLYEWNGSDAWVEVAGKLGTEICIYSLAVYNDKLYGGTAQNGRLYEWNGSDAWVEVAGQAGGTETYIYSLAVYNDKLYGGTYPNGRLYEWNGSDAWVEVAGKLGTETFILSLAVYNDKLYGGTYPNGRLYEWNGSDAWVEVAGKLGTEDYILSLAVYNDKLYGGTHPNGRLYEWAFNLITASESTIKTQGSYSLKGIATTDALNETLTRTIDPTIDLSGMDHIAFDVRSIRTIQPLRGKLWNATGESFELGFAITASETWQHKIIDISAIPDSSKNTINQISFEVINADTANTFYIDNMYAY